MKYFREYEPDELLALTTEEVERLVDLECAHRGVALIPASPAPPTEVQAGPDVTVYNAGGAMFKDEADALKVCDLLNSLPKLETYYLGTGYSYSGPQGVRLGDRETAESPTQSTYWTEAHHDKHRVSIAAYKEAKATYDKDRKAYESALTERTAVAEEIAAVRHTAQDELDTAALVRREFERYLDLADQSRDVALKFYLDATHFTEDFIRETLGFNAPQEALDTPAEDVI